MCNVLQIRNKVITYIFKLFHRHLMPFWASFFSQLSYSSYLSTRIRNKKIARYFRRHSRYVFYHTRTKIKFAYNRTDYTFDTAIRDK